MIEKLKLEIYKDIKFEGDPIHEISLQINPEDFKEDKSISYGAKSEDTPEFKNYSEEKLSFNFTIDGTGVILSDDKSTDFVYKRVHDLEQYLYSPFADKDGNNPQPHYVLIRWGRLFFKGRLETMNVHYTLFKPSGEPLRAKVSLSFMKVVKNEEKPKTSTKVNKEEKDKIIIVKSGDTLPFLCQREYGDSSKAEKIAKDNNLSSFRDIKVGQSIRFT